MNAPINNATKDNKNTPIAIYSDPDLACIILSDKNLPATWCQRANYLGTTGGVNWLRLAQNNTVSTTKELKSTTSTDFVCNALQELKTKHVDCFVSLGVGDFSKDKEIISFLTQDQNPITYIPIDISYALLEHTITHVDKDNRCLTYPIHADFEQGGDFIKNIIRQKTKTSDCKIICLIGGTFGNLDKGELNLFRFIDHIMNVGDIFIFDYTQKNNTTENLKTRITRIIESESGKKFLADGLKRQLNQTPSIIPLEPIISVKQDCVDAELKREEISISYRYTDGSTDTINAREVLRIRAYDTQDLKNFIKENFQSLDTILIHEEETKESVKHGFMACKKI
jgi:hypothetical protein